jgi:hypothetical protein
VPFEDARGHDCKDIPLATKVHPLAGSKDFFACFHTLHPTLCICVCVCVYEYVYLFLSVSLSLCFSAAYERHNTDGLKSSRVLVFCSNKKKKKKPRLGKCSETELPSLHLHFLSLGATKILARRRSISWCNHSFSPSSTISHLSLSHSCSRVSKNRASLSLSHYCCPRVSKNA